MPRNVERMANAESLIAQIAERIVQKDWAEWEPAFNAWDAPWELIRTIHELHNDPQVQANGMIFKATVGDTPH